MDSTNSPQADSSIVKITPKDFFLNFGAVVALYVSAISLINLLFSVINYAFPDNLDYYVDPYSSGTRWAIAMLVVFFPIFLALARIVNNSLVLSPEKKNSSFRKALAYLTLFVAGLAVAIDLVALINSFLGGEITSRFALKVLTVLVVAGAIFAYYIFDLRRDVGQSEKKARLLGFVAIALVVLSLVFGFLVMGSPARARDLRFDERRVSDLSTIQWQVGEYWRNTGTLPADMATLTKDSIYGFVEPRDPDTNTAYEYTKTGDVTFTLCADFGLASLNNSISGETKYYSGIDSNWTHEAGRVCFEREVDPVRYPDTSNVPTKPIPVR